MSHYLNQSSMLISAHKLSLYYRPSMYLHMWYIIETSYATKTCAMITSIEFKSFRILKADPKKISSRVMVDTLIK